MAIDGMEDIEPSGEVTTLQKTNACVNAAASSAVYSEGAEEGEMTMEETVIECGRRARTASWFATLMNMIKTYLGSGLLSLPYAYKAGGLTATLLTIICVGAISCHCMYMLVGCKRTILKRGKTVVTFGDVGEATFGKAGLYLVNAMLIFTQYGFCCVYVVFVAGNTITLLSSYFADADEFRTVYIVLLWMPVFIGLSWVRTMRVLSLVSIFSIAAISASVIVILAASVVELVDIAEAGAGLDVEPWLEISSYATMLGMVIYSYEGIGIVLPCETSIRKESQFVPVLMGSLLLCTVNYALFGLIPYMAFGSETCSLITVNLQDFATTTLWTALSNITTLSLILAIAGTFPLQLFVVTDICEDYFVQKGWFGGKYQFWQENAFRTALVISAGVIGVAVPSFSTLVSLIGSIGSSSLAFIFPPLFLLKLDWKEMHIGYKLLYFAYMAFGLAAGILGTAQTLIGIIEGDTATC